MANIFRITQTKTESILIRRTVRPLKNTFSALNELSGCKSFEGALNTKTQASKENSNTKQNAKRKLLPCDKYEKGKCLNGVLCSYMHQEFPCLYYYLDLECPNKCCKFLHDGPLPVNLLEAFLKYAKTLHRKHLTPTEPKLTYEEITNLINKKQIELLRNKYVGFPYETLTKNDDKRIDETLYFLSKKQLTKLKEMGLKNHYDIIMLSTWQLNALGINDSVVYHKILASCLDIHKKLNSENLPLTEYTENINDNQRLESPTTNSELENNVNNETIETDENQIDLDDFKSVARLPKDIFCRKIYELHNYLLHNQLSVEVRNREIEKFRAQLKALEDELLSMLPVNDNSSKTTETPVVVIHNGALKELAEHQTSDIGHKIHSTSPPKETSTSDLEKGLTVKHEKNDHVLSGGNSVKCSDALSAENETNSPAENNKSEQNHEKECLGITKIVGVDAKKFPFVLRTCRVMIKRLKEIDFSPAGRHRKIVRQNPVRSSKRIRRETENKGNSPKKRLTLNFHDVNKDKNGTKNSCRKLQKSKDILPANKGNKIQEKVKQTSKTIDTILSSAEPNIICDIKGSKQNMDFSNNKKRKEAEDIKGKDSKKEDIFTGLEKIKMSGTNISENQGEAKDFLSIENEVKPIANKRNLHQRKRASKIVNSSQGENKNQSNKTDNLSIKENGKIKLKEDNIGKQKDSFSSTIGEKEMETNENSVLTTENGILLENQSFSMCQENKKEKTVTDEIPVERKNRLCSVGKRVSKNRKKKNASLVAEKKEKASPTKRLSENGEKNKHLTQSSHSLNTLKKNTEENTPTKNNDENKFTNLSENGEKNKNLTQSTHSLDTHKKNTEENTPTKNNDQNKLTKDIKENTLKKITRRESIVKEVTSTTKKRKQEDESPIFFKLDEEISKQYKKKRESEKSNSVNSCKQQSVFSLKDLQNKEMATEPSKKRASINQTYKEFVEKAKNRKSISLKLEKKSVLDAESLKIKGKEPILPLLQSTTDAVKNEKDNFFSKPFKIPKLNTTQNSHRKSSINILKSDSTQMSTLLHNQKKSDSNAQYGNIIRESNWSSSVTVETSSRIKPPISENHEDFIELTCSDIESWDESHVDNCKIKKTSFSSGFCSSLNTELTQKDLSDWDDEFMHMISKPQKRQRLTPIKNPIQAMQFSSTPKSFMKTQNISRAPSNLTEENKQNADKFVSPYLAKNLCPNILPWMLRIIDIPPYEVNMPKHFERLSLKNYKDPRLLRHINCMRLPPKRVFHQIQNDKNKILILRTLKNSVYCKSKYFAKLLLCDLIRFLSDYHSKCAMQDCFIEFNFGSMENATEINRLLVVLDLHINEYGEVMVLNPTSNSVNDKNVFQDQPKLCEHVNPFNIPYVGEGNQMSNGFERNKKDTLKNDYINHGNQQSKVFDPTFPHYSERNNNNSFKDHGYRQPIDSEIAYLNHCEHKKSCSFKAVPSMHRNETPQIFESRIPHSHGNNINNPFRRNHGQQQFGAFGPTLPPNRNGNSRRRFTSARRNFNVNTRFYRKSKRYNQHPREKY